MYNKKQSLTNRNHPTNFYLKVLVHSALPQEKQRPIKGPVKHLP